MNASPGCTWRLSVRKVPVTHSLSQRAAASGDFRRVSMSVAPSRFAPPTTHETDRSKRTPRIRLRRSAGVAPWGEAPKALRGGHSKALRLGGHVVLDDLRAHVDVRRHAEGAQ